MALLPVSNKFTTPHARKVWYLKIRDFAPQSVWMPTSNSFNYAKWGKIIARDIMALHKKGVSLTSNFIKDNNIKLWRAGVHVFGNWPKAVDNAKLTDRIGRPIDNLKLEMTDMAKRAEISNQIKGYLAKGEKVPSEIKLIARKYFMDGWKEAVEEAEFIADRANSPKTE